MTGALTLWRLALRRDRVRITVWVVGLTGLLLVSAASVVGLYDTQEDLERYARLVRDNTALIVQSGPGYGLDDPTVGAVVMNEAGVWAFLAISVMALMTVVRHTRADEDAERTDLVLATPTGRHAPAAAALATVTTAAVVIAAVTAAGFVVLDLPVAGSIAFAAALVVNAVAVGALALVVAQVASSARGATGLGLLVIAASFIARAVGDVTGGPWSWLSPIGWGQAIRAYADERWWVLLVPLAVAAGAGWLAVALSRRRDLGAGLLSLRPGPPHARNGFRSAGALARRLQRGALLAWCAGVAVLGAFYGVVGEQAEDFLTDNPDLEDFLAQAGSASLTDAYLGTTLLMTGLVGAGATIALALRPRGEEAAGRAEPVLATPTRRAVWLGGHVAIAVAGAVLVIGAGGLATGVGYGAASGDGAAVGRLLAASLVHVPPALVLAGVATLLVGAVPRWSVLAWAGLAVATVVGVLGAVLDLPQWARDVSPAEHVPLAPAEDVHAGPLLVLLAIALALLTAGVAAFQRRDVPA
jgi:ABC-2 type transport system permease protein